MALDKAIAYGKEYRKAYTGAKAVDCSCRNHGTCEWCKNNRLYQQRKEKQKMKEREDSYGKMGI